MSHFSLTFSNEELTPEGITHTRSLQITIECMDAKVSMVLVDNRSKRNVCPFRTALKVGLDMETITHSPLWAQAPITICFSHLFRKYALAEWTGQRVKMESPTRLGIGNIYIYIYIYRIPINFKIII